jgi:formate hydrogenlyase subunit 3/multisubunit Na+/H+ antiporter MnhD subunit
VILLQVCLALFAAGALLAALFGRLPTLASVLGSSFAALGSVVGLLFAVSRLLSGQRLEAISLPWALPNAVFTVGIDPLSSFFLVPLFLLGAITAIYGHFYLGGTGAKPRRGLSFISFNLLLASMALLLIARHSLLFVLAWEVMSLSAYLLVTYEHEQHEVRSAGWIYLVAAHVGVSGLLALFFSLYRISGSFDFATIAAMPTLGFWTATGLFLLAILGFGVKAGIYPLHVWLPQAHAAAPSHVSALMSGVLIKMGIYGILRIVVLLGGPRPYWGAALLCLGVFSALLGIVMAVHQRDLKRVLAYSSVENIGIVLLGLGLGFWGSTTGHPLVAAFGIIGALLHVWFHCVMKGLMFLLSGAVLHACHTKDLEQLGGLGKRMPVTFGLFVLGGVAISGLPPLNAFVSEWMLYSGLMKGALMGRGAGAVACVFAVALLSLIGALAALCFTRLIGSSMLGEPRSPSAEKAHETGVGMLVPMLLLGVLLVAQALAPLRFFRLLAPAVAQLLEHGPNDAWPLGLFSGLHHLGQVNLTLMALLVVAVVIGGLVWGKRRVGAVVGTWDCGYVAPTARMQYTARGFSELLTETVVPRLLRPRIEKRLPRGIFSGQAELVSNTSDPMTRDIYEPFFTRWADRFARLRWMQQGHLHIYLLYILTALLVALAYAAVQSNFAAP